MFKFRHCSSNQSRFILFNVFLVAFSFKFKYFWNQIINVWYGFSGLQCSELFWNACKDSRRIFFWILDFIVYCLVHNETNRFFTILYHRRVSQQSKNLNSAIVVAVCILKSRRYQNYIVDIDKNCVYLCSIITTVTV